MSPRLKTTLALVGSFVLGGSLLYLALRGVDFSGVADALRTAHYGWLAPLIAVTLVAHVLRAWRWQMLLDTLADEDESTDKPVSLTLAFYSVMIGYMVNYAAPRLGEVARAANVASRSALRFPAVFGTVVVERVLDVLTLGVALVTVVALFRERLAGVASVFAENVRGALAGLPAVPWAVVLLALLAAGVGGAGLLWRLLRGSGKVAGVLRSFRDGLASLLRVRQKAGVLLTSAGIWFCYLLMADIPLRMLGFSSAFGLRLVDSWALMNVGAIGMSLPSPGGTGSFHYVTVQTLVHLFAVPETPAATYALLTHAAQLVLFCAAGFVCLLLQGTSLRALRQATTAAQANVGPAEA